MKKKPLRPQFTKKVSRGQITKDWLPIQEAATALGVSRRQIHRLVAEKKLRAAAIIWPSGYRIEWITRGSLERYRRERYTE